MKYLLTGDLELTRARLEDIKSVFYGPGGILEIVALEQPDGIIFGGDIWREYNKDTVEWMKTLLQDILIWEAIEDIILLVGNHDREIGTDKLTATFKGWNPSIQIIDKPTILGNLAFLPAPDRAAFGASRPGEGRQVRDAALSEALDAALKLLFDEARESETVAPGETALVYHATLDAALFGGVKIASGLTWTVPSTEVARWGMGIGFHIHSPADYPAERFGTAIHTIGAPVPDTFGVKGETFRVGIVEVGPHPPRFKSVALPRVVQRIEIDIRRDGDRIIIGDGDFFIPDLSDPAEILALYVSEIGGIEFGDRLIIKINAHLPEADLAILPDPVKIRGNLAWVDTNAVPSEIVIRKIPTGLVKSRLDEEARKGGLAPADLVRKWAEVSGYEGSKTVDIAVSLVEGEEAFEDWNSAGLSGFNPIKTTVHNFRQYENAEIDWTSLAGRVAITGINASGKSNIAKATIFGLYKRTPSSPGLDDELRRGEKSGSVEVEFEAGGKRYQVRRVLERNTKGRVSCKSELFETFPGTLRPALPVCENARDIDKKIAELVGGYDFVVSTFFASEAQIDALTRATPSEWRKQVIEALSLDTFEKFRERSGREARDLDRRARGSEAGLEEVAALYDQKKKALSNYPNADDIAGKKMSLGIAVEGLEITKADNEEANGKDKARLSDNEKKARGVEALVKDSEAAEGDYKRTEAALKALPVLGDPPPDVFDLAIPDLSADRALLDKKGTERDNARKILDRIVLERQSAKGKIQDARRALSLTLEEVEKLEKELAASPGVPCQDIESSRIHAVRAGLWESCPAFAAWGSGGRISDLTEDARLYKVEAENQEARIKRLGDQRAEADIVFQDANETTETLKAALEVNEKTRDDYVNAQAARTRWEANKIRRESAETDLAAAAEKVQDISKAAEDYKTLAGESVLLEAGIAVRQKAIDALAWDIRKARTDISTIDRTLQIIMTLREDTKNLDDRRRFLQADISALRGEESGWILLEKAFHSTGIPFLLLEDALPAIASEANRLLASTDLSVSIRSVRENKDGAKADDIDVRYLDPRGEFPLCVSSGAQEKLLGFTLRFALAKVGGDFWGTPPRIFVQDEGFGAFSPDRYDQVREIIRLIAEDFDRFVYITHVTALSDDADIKFEAVALSDNLSELRRIL